MTTVNNNQTATNVLDKYAVQQSNSSSSSGTKGTGSSSALGKDQFMNLMLAQLNNQDPLNPTDNTQFLAQLAQFSSLEQMQNLNTSVQSFSSQFRSQQALQASAMVGRSVVAQSNTASLGASGKISGFADLANATNDLKVQVLDSSGSLVKTMDLGQQPAGQVAFNWDGKDAGGNSMPTGSYTLNAVASDGAGGSAQVPTLISANVNSVSIGSDGSITLNLADMGSVPLSSVTQIN
ncbi:flagellar hook assembly protein FlgD [Mangrovitalea sediminis]|uniref:flagellar hook assembly protein FlgD n=1 Tax=Mangrovitalea sediminis TaxID=1982043 RepID=UPI000BE58C01|nr:flagellar hook assembly protein FlgD [Mangrovitalea sediminis]